MSILELLLSTWFLATVVTMTIAILLGMFAMRRARASQLAAISEPVWPAVEVLVPTKGVSSDQVVALTSLVNQDYPNYQVSFILESRRDEANEIVTRLCEQYGHAHKIISGIADSCGQKNHNLIAGIRALKPETEIIMLCDSTNAADPEWLRRFIAPLVTGDSQVVTTFRVFKPQPETVGGVCQAIYASLLRVLDIVRPTPWGGATAISRATFDRLGVVEVWSRTVIDDLVLGNILEAAGVKVTMDPCNLLDSPLRNQSVQGFLAFLDRQILGPKFTNLGMWLMTLNIGLNLALAVLAAMILGTLSAAGIVSATLGWAALIFLLALLLTTMLLRKITPSEISAPMWLICVIPCVLLTAFVCLRSIVVNHIDWHGRRYWPGKWSEHLRSESLNQERGLQIK